MLSKPPRSTEFVSTHPGAQHHIHCSKHVEQTLLGRSTATLPLPLSQVFTVVLLEECTSQSHHNTLLAVLATSPILVDKT